MVRLSTAGSDRRDVFSLSIFCCRNRMTACKKSTPCAATLSANHLSRFRYSRREAKAATSKAKVNGWTSKRGSKIFKSWATSRIRVMLRLFSS